MSTRVGCKSSSQPWFATQFTCTILEINCYRQGISDSAHEIDIALRRVNPDGLNSLIISHCPALSIPPRIQELPYLDALEINNASLLKWGEDAKVTHSTMPALQMLAFVRVNMTALPDAILTSDLSHRLRDLTISESNLTTLPPDLAIKWRRLFDLFIERTRVEVIAPTLAISSPMRLSLMGNQIHELPDDLFVHSQFSVLSVAKNPITKWPETIGNLDYLTMLLLDYTEIEELPSWLLDEGQHRGKTGKIITVSAGGSAYCRAKSALPSFSAVDESNTGLRVECRVKPEEEYEAYPLSYNTRHRPV
ncbi:hypothetical protein Poli38472_004770 [Pythium oligandrum]|uniref:Uncharacterized protein n=1 Tax=Pythium oligandrum TaxID=41045 RepID=A0A8K1FER0_PYTOL|nr:hypothetical protein Poli38472_004770 [Pythium oligandrum]|eukprot:TMW59701.1 hypothetical protein Poli38472_004770 [Pythium oligandrum]